MRAYNELFNIEAFRRRIEEIEEMRNNYESEYEYFVDHWDEIGYLVEEYRKTEVCLDDVDFVHTVDSEPVKKYEMDIRYE